MSSASNDWEIDRSTFYVNGEKDNTLFTGEWGGCNWGGVRFKLPSDGIPSGAQIKSTELQVLSNGTDGWDSGQHLKVFVSNSSDAGKAGSAGDRPNIGPDPGGTKVYPGDISAGVRWPASGGLDWPASGTWAKSSDLSSLVQHLVDANSGLKGGAHLTFWFVGPTCAGQHEVKWYDVNAGSTKGAKLVLTYEVSGTNVLSQETRTDVKVKPWDFNLDGNVNLSDLLYLISR